MPHDPLALPDVVRDTLDGVTAPPDDALRVAPAGPSMLWMPVLAVGGFVATVVLLLAGLAG